MLPTYEPLLGFKLTHGEILIYQIGNSSKKRPWLAIRHCFPKGYEISEGDVVKLGRIRMKVKKIALTFTSEKREEISKCFDSFGSQIEVNKEVECEACCRICFCNEVTESNPLIAPCECTGSIKFIHVECIKSWLRSRIQTKTTGLVVSYYSNDLICELCKTPLPASVFYIGTKIDLISIEYPKKPYIIFEECRLDTKIFNAIHVITLESGKSVSIGRSQDVELRFTDISVSRKHAMIFSSGKGVFISDNRSKFGTLIKMKKVFSLAKGKNLSLQIGRTMIHVCAKKKFTCKKCCCISFRKIVPESSYITQEGLDHSFLDSRIGLYSNSIQQCVENIS